MNVAMKRMVRAGVVWAAVLGAAALTARGTVISDNTGSTTGGVENVTTTRWVAASFTTDASSHTLSQVILMMANTAPGAAVVEIRSDVVATPSGSGLEPGTLVGTLTAPGAYTSVIGPNAFTGSIALSANTTYWVVLRAASGAFTWGWTGTNTGSGTGFTNVWGVSEDSGSSWWSSDFYKTQMSVEVDGCISPQVTTQPSGSSGCGGRTVSLTVAGSGSGALSYIWRKGGSPLADGGRFAGTHSSHLTISGALGIDAGQYDAVISNTCGNAPSNAVTVGVCAADFNCSNQVTVQDLFDFLATWFGLGPSADINGSGSVSVQDVFDFLAYWFAGC